MAAVRDQFVGNQSWADTFLRTLECDLDVLQLDKHIYQQALRHAAAGKPAVVVPSLQGLQICVQSVLG